MARVVSKKTGYRKEGGSVVAAKSAGCEGTLNTQWKEKHNGKDG
jgi:hypothetical protein